jgi:hypothetical protein
MKTIHKFKEHKYIHDILKEGMEKFLRIHVSCFDNYENMPVNFIGSVAFYFQDELREAANKFNIRISSICKKPINGLVEYHLKHQLDKLHS